MTISKRLADMQASPIRKLAPYAAEAKSRGIHIYHLNIGQPDIKTPETILKAVRNLDIDVLAYGPSEGLEEYRSRLPEYYRRRGLPVDKEDILVTTAGSEAVLFALFAACDAGDEVIIPEPYYTNYNGFASQAGVSIVPVTCTMEDGFALPGIDAFRDKVTTRTKAIMICSPNNPTGAVYSRKALADLA
ncbi:MAG: aminotransferase class I/II-fold pyridoxal phosphate-dependent enzyme, partial [Spirochaetales bacterium]|nr:aminotransferase class I/II-fold pyridoxal phosphate-dependent enzyme [Spirochaetales bacterium]